MSTTLPAPAPAAASGVTPATAPAATPTPAERRVVVRPLLPGETGPVLAVFEGLTPEQRWQRFHTGMPRLSGTMLRHLTAVDDTHVALVLEVDGLPVGIGRYAVVDPGRVEVAVAVVDEHTGRGHGTRLLRELRDHAARNGIREAVFDVLPGNQPALRLARGQGARFEPAGSVLHGRISPLTRR